MAESKYHLIKGVPYVSQKTGFFCAYACPAMIFRFYGIDTNLPEALFNSGVGHSLVYPYTKYIPGSGHIASQWKNDKEFLASLYGCSYKQWNPNSNESSESWDIYWEQTKRYLRDNIPVKTVVNQIFLPTFKKLVQRYVRFNINVIPDFFWMLIPTIAHDIILVGFDENKGVVYYNNPATAVRGNAEEGTYANMKIETLKKAVESRKLKKSDRYSLEIYKKINSPLSREEIFQKARERNIEKMKGISEVYDSRWRKSNLGLNGLKKYMIDLENETKKSIIISEYKQTNRRLKMILNLSKIFVNYSFSKELNLSVFDRIAVEKQYITKFLEENKSLSEIYKHDALLFNQEEQNWKLLATYFSEFAKKRMLIKKSLGLETIRKMIEILDKIILLENKIINLS
jgi:hypothetical protein